MSVKLNPNGLGVNFLDTAILEPTYCLELLERFDMAQCTVISATHPRESFALAVKIKEKRPQTVVFFRRWKQDLPDERLPQQTTPQEWVNYFRDALDAGLTPAAYNESLANPLTPITKYSRGILDLIGSNPKYSSVHFKIAAGNPGGYAGEQLLDKTDSRYRPDGYAESDDLWIAAAAINKPRIDRGEFPGVWIAPHSYFPVTGSSAGLTDRHREIYRRGDALKIDRHYLPLAAGESGIIQTNPMDSEAGFSGLIDAAAYADVLSLVMFNDYLPYRLIPHLYGVGRGSAGQWARFDLMHVNAFWDRLERIIASGAYRLPFWYGAGYLNATNTPQRPASLGDGIKLTLAANSSYLNLRSKPDITGLDIGNVMNGETVTIFPETKTPQTPFTWYYISRSSPTPGESRDGWVAYDPGMIPSPPPIVIDPPTPKPGIGVKITYAFSYDNVPADKLEALKNAHAALADYFTYSAKLAGLEPPQLRVTEGE